MDNVSLFFSIFNLNGRSFVLDQSMIFATVPLIYLTFLLVFVLAIKGGIREKKAFLLTVLALPLAVLLIKTIHLFFYDFKKIKKNITTFYFLLQISAFSLKYLHVS